MSGLSESDVRRIVREELAPVRREVHSEDGGSVRDAVTRVEAAVARLEGSDDFREFGNSVDEGNRGGAESVDFGAVAFGRVREVSGEGLEDVQGSSHVPEGRGGWGRVGIALLGGIVLGGLLVLAGFATAAHAGSDSPTPYRVDADGVTLPGGVTFPAHGHVNLQTSVGGKGIHFDPNNGHPGGQWIGQSFIPWAVFGLAACDSVSWVQVHGYNEHFGEGGQSPVVVGPCPEPTVTPTSESTPEVSPEPTVELISEPAPVLAVTGAADGIFWLLGVCTVILGGLLVAIRAVAAGSKPRYKRGA